MILSLFQEYFHPSLGFISSNSILSLNIIRLFVMWFLFPDICDTKILHLVALLFNCSDRRTYYFFILPKWKIKTYLLYFQCLIKFISDFNDSIKSQRNKPRFLKVFVFEVLILLQFLCNSAAIFKYTLLSLSVSIILAEFFDISIYHFAEQPFTHKTDLKDTVAELVGSYQIQDATLKITRGDYSPILNRVVRRLESAKVAMTESFAFAALLRGN